MPLVDYRMPEAVLCLDGTLPDRDFFTPLHTVPLIAADGAALRLVDRGLMPSVVIGDLDTLHAEGRDRLPASVPVLHNADQDSTDFEKCLAYCLAQELHTVLICGIHGGAMEHSLNNWSIVMRYAERLHLCLYDAGRYGLPLHRSAILPTCEGDIISLIPQPRAVLTTTGLYWPLHGEELRMGGREGARNRATDTRIGIHLHEGSLLLFCNATLPLMPVHAAAAP